MYSQKGCLLHWI